MDDEIEAFERLRAQANESGARWAVRLCDFELWELATPDGEGWSVSH